MDLFEYQAKQLFERYDVPVSLGEVATSPDQAQAAAEQIGGVTVVKAQVKIGGRGKAGGVKVAKTPGEAATRPERSSAWTSRATRCTGCSSIRAPTSGGVLRLLPARPGQPHLPGHGVLRGRHGDRAARRRAAGCPGQGGGRCADRCRPAKAREIVAAARFPAEVADDVADVLVKLWDAFVGADATLVEVNPLAKVRAADGRSRSALDGKVTLDENANFRQPGNAALVDVEPPTRSSSGRRRSTSTTSSSTGRSASSATGRGW